jgi:hypothetical protein
MDQNLQLEVIYMDHSMLYYPVAEGWKIDPAQRVIVVGRGVPRTMIPLDNVRAFSICRV